MRIEFRGWGLNWGTLFFVVLLWIVLSQATTIFNPVVVTGVDEPPPITETAPSP